MFESFGFEDTTPQQVAIVLGLILGLVFGAMAEITRFCIRRGLVGPVAERRPALGVWLTALATAVIGTQIAVASGAISFDEHRFMAADLPWLAILIGGGCFGAGMVLTNGCISRLTVLIGTGNLRALTVLLIFAITAHATLKGVLSSVRTTLGSVTVPLGETTSLAALPGGGLFWGSLIGIAALTFAGRSGARPQHLILAALIGLLVPLAWVGTGFVLFDEFDPIAMESLSFTSPSAETLFWTIASSAIPAGFGTGLLAGVVIGAFGQSLIAGRFQWQSFEAPRQTRRYFAGAMLMGFGGVLAGGCTVGAGLAGIPTLSLAAILAMGSIALGAVLTNQLIGARAATPVTA
ncbi:MAG: YeeE/YedE family protein [Paracoccaceae bacterium]